jgi:hypothetical protein
MDTFSHGFWIWAAFKAAKTKSQKPINIFAAVWWGIWPDIVSFGIASLWIIYALIIGQVSFSDMPRPDTIEASQAPKIFLITQFLYNFSHSLVVFSVIFIFVCWYFRKIVWELLGWLLHIFMDIPTHASYFFPTPIFWPVSDWTYHGFNWEEYPLFWILNFSAIALVYVIYKVATKIAKNKS